MKFSIYLTTAVVVLYTLLTQMGVSFPIVFMLFIVSQIVLVYMIYRILTDKYQTQRTFEDWYGGKDVRRKNQK
ncbi:hypothetical protein [Roseivirga sp. 4D4]|uniref:hypothetical protein n=1 Tax=Roseivirga sp. 4D4 TaxID=1889784 RepID=UPI001112DF41|nr:hypothetical protein [Roseivirga sp. 4D4]